MGCFCGRASFDNQHVLVTGGSQGLGLQLATLFAAENARVTIISRNQGHLQDAINFIRRQYPNAQLQSIAADVTQREQIIAKIREAVDKFGPVDVLVTCAGRAPTGYFQTESDATFREAMELNYYGTLYPVQAVVPNMKARRMGRILFVSSGLALTGYIGYSAYCPSKWAVKGLGEALRNELQAYNIQVSQTYPPNMATPGYEVENRTKPTECKSIESGETTYQPQDVARSIISGLKSGDYHIFGPDFGLNMLTRLTTGMGPRGCALADCCILPIAVLVGKIYVSAWDKEARRQSVNNPPSPYNSIS